MANLLVTGGAGFVGANFVQYWTKHHPNDFVVVLDALTYAGNYQNLASLENLPTFQFVCGNILNRQLVEDLLRSRQLDVIVNFAAESHVDRSILNPDDFIKTNVEGTHSLLSAARNVWLNGGKPDKNVRFHHISSKEVYGDLKADEPPFSEKSPYKPASPFAASKAAADNLVRSYYETYGLPVTISNSPNNFGRYHYPDKLIPLVIASVLHDNPLPVYGDGQQVRDWIYVQDHCRGIEQVLLEGRPGETYHIGGNTQWANIEMVEFICRYMDQLFLKSSTYRKNFPNAVSASKGSSRKLITHMEDRPGQLRRSVMDASKIKHELKWRPRYTIKGALEYTISWYLRHLSWLNGVEKNNIAKSTHPPYTDRYALGSPTNCCSPM